MILIQTKGKPTPAPLPPPYALLLCFGTKSNPSATLPKNISEILTQSPTNGLASNVSSSVLPLYAGGLSFIFAGIRSRKFPEEMWEGDFSVKAGSDDDKRVVAFLKQMKDKHGSNSVCYISFGSLFFPIFRPELIRYILKTLQGTGVPFVFAYAYGIVPVPNEVIEEFAGLEDACFVKFAPQWAVLKHQATGFFLTHCGSNSTHETIMAKVPIVSMPFAANQGEIASLLTDVLHVGIDLKQTKTFIKPPFNKLYDGTVVEGTKSAIKDEMRTVWQRMKGKEGEEMCKGPKYQMRVRMGEVKERLRESFNNGRGKQDMIKLGECRL
ncbi:hypothetical protein B9479_008252 [Cryptococcus floricola]|uniref:Uncharacterized protein n=1 Tax=Cryptococcus floricola TaxID=2591691 RepID=A0A5D3AK57_9TREE|nr:hypothetical protein B9479_008252 [Cryptococcus floricola]